MAAVKDCYALTAYYEKQFRIKHGYNPSVNKFKARWGWDAILHGLSVADVKELIDYYFLTDSPNRHDLEMFFRNYEKLITAKEQYELDAVRRAKIRSESEVRAAEWRARRDNQRSTGN